jgi:hypothetical protein
LWGRENRLAAEQWLNQLGYLEEQRLDLLNPSTGRLEDNEMPGDLR